MPRVLIGKLCVSFFCGCFDPCHNKFSFVYQLENTLIDCVLIITDIAKSENTNDLTVYTSLESTAMLTVKFEMNPVNNYSVQWSMGDLLLQNIHVKDIIDGEQIQASCVISDVTNKQLGNYTVKVINWAIENEENEVTFNVILKLENKKSKSMSFSLCSS